MLEAKNDMVRIKLVCGILILSCGIMPRQGLGEPWIQDLRESEDPVLAEASRYDLEFQPAAVANQSKAERLYLQYIEAHPDSELIPYLYYRLGHTYTSCVTPAHRAAGAVQDTAKARRYFRQAIARYPEGKLGSVLLDSHVNVVALAPTPEEQVDGYVEYYRLLKRIETLTDDNVIEKMWLSQRQQAIAQAREDYAARSAQGFRGNLGGRKEIAAINMVGCAEQSEANTRVDLLGVIAAAFPDDEPGKLARASLRRFTDRVLNEQVAGLGEDEVSAAGPPQAEQAEVDPVEQSKPSGDSGSTVDATDAPSFRWVLVAVVLGIALGAAWLLWARFRQADKA